MPSHKTSEYLRRTSVLQHAETAFEPPPFDADAARAFGIVCAAILATGRTPRRRIAAHMIAAIAMVSRIPLYTTNPDDFTGLDHLLTIKPVQ